MQHQQGAELAYEQRYCDYIELTARHAHERASNTDHAMDIADPIAVFADVSDNSIHNHVCNRCKYVTSRLG